VLVGGIDAHSEGCSNWLRNFFAGKEPHKGGNNPRRRLWRSGAGRASAAVLGGEVKDILLLDGYGRCRWAWKRWAVVK